VEEDFFALFLQEQPTALLGKHNVEHTNKLAEIQSRIVVHEKAIDNLAKAVAATDNLPQVVRELNAETVKRDKATAELEETNRKMLSANNAPLAFDSIKKALLTTPMEMETLDKIMEQLNEQLADNEVRKRLLEMLPALVQRLEMSTEKRQYRVVNASGEVSDWEYVGE
jgi:signal recognition particle GTPase